jgi:hypothetical protein
MFIWQGAMVEKLPRKAPPPVTAKAGKKLRGGLRRLFAGRGQ